MSAAGACAPRWLRGLVALGVLGAGSALGQTAAEADHSAHHPPAAASAPAGDEFTEGEVRRVDRANAKLTLRHGEIKNLGMPPMTMVFQVADPATLDTLKAGDKVLFRAAQEGGQYRVTELRRVGG